MIVFMIQYNLVIRKDTNNFINHNNNYFRI